MPIFGQANTKISFSAVTWFQRFPRKPVFLSARTNYLSWNTSYMSLIAYFISIKSIYFFPVFYGVSFENWKSLT